MDDNNPLEFIIGCMNIVDWISNLFIKEKKDKVPLRLEMPRKYINKLEDNNSRRQLCTDQLTVQEYEI